MKYQCRYCLKSFAEETTLGIHICERKRRFQQENEIGVRWGFQAYIWFYETTQQVKPRTYEDFVDSAYYTAFVRYGRHCHSISCINFASFTSYLLKNNKKLDEWTKELFYSEWLFDYLRRESVRDALERSMQTMVNYMQDHPEYKNGYQDYFRLVNENRICYHVSTGRVSVWAVYNCESGQDFLGRLNTDQLSTIIGFIDPDFWQSKFNDCPEDTKFGRQILKMAGL